MKVSNPFFRTGILAVLICYSCVVSMAQQKSTKATTRMLVQKALAAALEAYRPMAEQQWVHKQIIHPADSAVLRFEYRIFGDKPADGRSLYISLHGGGNAPAEVNDRQWTNQISLYKPKEGVYVAPRAPTNTWMLWHENHIDALFDELIKTAIVMEDVNPNKVYLLGYSAGGDGVFQLAPRMADRWAAASMMAGHPGDASILNLRNLPFAIFMGGKDAAYNRNGLAAEWGKKLDSLQQSDSQGYPHSVKIYPEDGHWMQRKDTIAIDWMAGYHRKPNPNKVIWVQDDRLHDRFYWLGVPQDNAATGKTLIASINKQTITIEHNDYDTFYLYLTDGLVNFNKPVRVIFQGKQLFKGKVKHNPQVITETAELLDEGKVAVGRLNYSNGKIMQ
ncbi:dienelactone hydrolase family protein [Parapedobacter sp. GCM10030251]|uniref:dienelactone hydrolase family protein n=1 Tax=Parapedobacter sp. GCM10030251 TaxID=3273419 RepID=UPI00366D705F